MTKRARVNKARLFEELEYAPHPGQWEIHNSNAPRRVVACGTRFGKTRAASMEGLAAALTPAERSIGWIVAPTYDLCDRIFREVELVVMKHLRHRVVSIRESDRRILLTNLGGGTSEIRGKSADNPVSLLGEGLDWVVVDEAARLKPVIWQSHISQRLIDKRGWALLISTPRGKGWFYDAFRAGQGGDPSYASWNFPSWANPMLDRALIDEERTHLPERVFRQEFGAEFLEGSGSVFRYVRESATGSWQPPQPREIYFAGLDLAKVADFTVLVIMNAKREVVFVDRFNKLDWGLQVQRIKAACDRFNHSTIYCDSTGVGEPVFEALRVAGCIVEPYTLTAASKDALIKNLAMQLEQRQIVLPTPELWPEGIDELEAFEYSVTESGHTRTGAPSGIHDDCVIALALSAWQLRMDRSRVPTFFVLRDPRRISLDRTWKRFRG